MLGVEGDPRFVSSAGRKINEAALDDLIAEWTAELDQWDVTRKLQELGVAAFPSLDAQSIDVDPHFDHRGLIERLDHPVVGAMAHVGVPWLAHDGPNGVQGPAPMLGADTDDVLDSLLGLTVEEIQDLRDRHILR